MNVSSPVFEGLMRSNSFSSVGNLQVINTLSTGYMYVGNGNLESLSLEVKGKSYPVENYFATIDSLSSTASLLASESDRSFKIRSEQWWSNVDESYTDANNIIINGCGSTIGGSYTNLPSDSDGWGTLYCFSNGANVVQLYFGWNAGDLWFRCYHGGYSWQEWINLNTVASNAKNALDKVVTLENKFNNLFTQNGNDLTINY